MRFLVQFSVYTVRVYKNVRRPITTGFETRSYMLSTEVGHANVCQKSKSPMTVHDLKGWCFGYTRKKVKNLNVSETKFRNHDSLF